jgi:hypothetical protein
LDAEPPPITGNETAGSIGVDSEGQQYVWNVECGRWDGTTQGQSYVQGNTVYTWNNEDCTWATYEMTRLVPWGVVITRTFAEMTAREAADLCEDSYYDVSTPRFGWKEATDLSLPSKFRLNDKTSGFQSRIYQRELPNGKFEYAYVFRGSEMKLNDWINNGHQAYGLSEQYNIAVNNAIMLNELIGDSRLTFVGHSLGGGLAMAASFATGRDAIVFNPAWISGLTNSRYGLQPNGGANITNYVVKGEILHTLQQALTLSDVVNAPLIQFGEINYFSDPKMPAIGSANMLMSFQIMGELHTMESILRGLKCDPKYNRVRPVYGK